MARDYPPRSMHIHQRRTIIQKADRRARGRDVFAFTRHFAIRLSRRSERASPLRMQSDAPCVNNLVCDNPRSPTEDTCATCGPWFKLGGFGFGRLDIDETSATCPVCANSVNHMVRFPQCTHSVCVTCFREIMFFDESRAHLDPRPYGCPPCPNGCDNPRRGKQCYCDEYDEVQEEWQASDPRAWNAWNRAEEKSIEQGDSYYATAKCPFCRVVYDRSKHGFCTRKSRIRVECRKLQSV